MVQFESQSDNYTCGIYSVVNAIKALGGSVTREEVYKHSGTRYRTGTSPVGILIALYELGYSANEYLTSSPDSAWRFVRRWSARQPVIALVDDQEHYFVVAGKIDRRVIVIDSSKGAGASSVCRSELLARWSCRGGFYCIRVSR